MNRQEKIASYGKAYDILKSAMDRIPEECWHYRPAPDRWTIHEIIMHVTDSEANSYVRCRRFIAEPNKDLMAYDENQWAKALDYPNQSTELALELFRWLRKASYELILTIPEETWSHQAYHPENGNMSLDNWLDSYERHVRDHVAQMEENYQDWKDQRKG